MSLDRAAEQLHARPEHDVDVRPLIEQLEKTRERRERSGEIGVPVANKVRVRRERLEHSCPYRLGLALVRLLVAHANRIGRAAAHLLKQVERGIAAAVVDEQEFDPVSGRPELGERAGIQSPSLVEARDDDDRMGQMQT